MTSETYNCKPTVSITLAAQLVLVYFRVCFLFYCTFNVSHSLKINVLSSLTFCLCSFDMRALLSCVCLHIYYGLQVKLVFTQCWNDTGNTHFNQYIKRKIWNVLSKTSDEAKQNNGGNVIPLVRWFQKIIPSCHSNTRVVKWLPYAVHW